MWNKFRMPKLWAIIALVAVLSPALSARGDSGSSGKIKIGVSIQGFKGIFTHYIVAGIKDYVKDMTDVEVIVVDAQDNPATQVGQIENFIVQGVDAIVLNPVDKEASAPALDIAQSKGVPLITVNTQVSNQQLAAAHVGSDDVVSGELQMQHLADALGGAGKVAILHGAIGHSAQVARMKGYQKILKKYPKMELVADQTGEWQTDKSLKIVENWIQSGLQLDAIACNNDTMALGAQIAVDNAGLDTLVSGMDAIPDVLTSIKNGGIDSTLWQDGIGQGKGAVRLAIAAAKGEAVSDYIIPFEVIDQSNIEAYIAKAKERDALNKKYQ